MILELLLSQYIFPISNQFYKNQHLPNVGFEYQVNIEIVYWPNIWSINFATWVLASAPCCSLYCASRYCQLTGYCYLFCHESEGSFSLWKILASPNMNEDATEGVKNCWTNRPSKNFIPALSGVSIRGSNTIPAAPKRILENLIDGIYTFKRSDVYQANSEEYTYFVIDLGMKKMIEKIVLYSTDIDGDLRFEKLSIRLGNHEVGNDFSSYEEIYYYVGPNPTTDFVLTIALDVPVSARYVSVQIMDDRQTRLLVAHIEIFLTNSEEYKQSLLKYDI